MAIEQLKSQSWSRPPHRAAVGRGLDERPASWKALLPYRDDARVLAVDVDAGTLASLSRTYRQVDSACRDGAYDVIVRGLPGNDALVDRLSPGGYWVDLTGAVPPGLCETRKYAMLPADHPRLIVPMAPRRARSAGLRFHRPTRPHTRLLARIAARLSDFGAARHLGAPGVIVSRRPGPMWGQTLAQWLSERIGRRIEDIVPYTGSGEPHRKITALAIGPAQTADIVVKLADTSAATRAIACEKEAIHAVALSTLAGCAPRPICAGQWGGYTVAAQSILRGRPSELVLTDAHLAWLRRLARIGATTLPLSATRLWSETHAARRDDVAAELADIDALDGGIPTSCHMIHGDFAPWNLQRRGGLVLAVDWEDADMRGPSGVDAMHFLFRTASSVGPWPGGRVMAAQMRLAAAQLGAGSRQNDAVMRLWLAREAWTQPMSRDHAVDTLAHL